MRAPNLYRHAHASLRQNYRRRGAAQDEERAISAGGGTTKGTRYPTYLGQQFGLRFGPLIIPHHSHFVLV